MVEKGRNAKGHFTSENQFAQVNRKFRSAKKMQAGIDEYFESGMSTRTFLTGTAPYQKEVLLRVPTITELALFLGFASRQSFYDYEKDGRFSYAIKRARLKIEINYEQMLQINTVASGPIFALKNMGWTDKTEVAVGGVEGGPPIVISLGNGIKPDDETTK